MSAVNVKQKGLLGAWDGRVGERGLADVTGTHGHTVSAARLGAALADRLAAEDALAQMVGDHPSMVTLRRSLPGTARRRDAVLIVGEEGTGRSLCARILHMLGDAADLPLVTVSCRALGVRALETLASGCAGESPRRGSHVRKALFEVTGGGTLVLEEVSALSLESQALLARVLQPANGAVCLPNGGRVRVLATTSRDLDELVRTGAFRRDLRDCLSASRLRLPPLRERGGDARVLVRHFARTLRRDRDWRHALWEISPAAVRRLAAQAWPANVRGLRDAVKRALRRAGSGQILPAHVDLFSVVAAASCDRAAESAPLRARAPRPNPAYTPQLPADEFAGVVRAYAVGQAGGSSRA